MRCNVILFVAAIFLCFPAMAKNKQVSEAPASSKVGNQFSANSAIDCSGGFESLRAARQLVDHDQRTSEAQNIPASASEGSGTESAASVAVDLDQDSKLVEQKQMEVTRCILGTYAQELAQDSPDSCFGEPFLTFEMRHDGEPEQDIPIARLPGSHAFFYESGMTIDADGAPNAYHPNNSGLDDLANAGTPGRWEGLAKDADGEPYIQGPGDPFPGYYVSATALADRSKAVNDPARYVDASRIPFVVLPGLMARQLDARVGDFAIVFNRRNGKISYAIFGDVGPFDRIGEGSMALAENLGIRSDARNGGARRGILYLVFPGSGDGRPHTIEEINAQGQKLILDWETSISSNACVAPQPARPMEGNRTTD
jgi:methionine-rich copper-binding protein CopC